MTLYVKHGFPSPPGSHEGMMMKPEVNPRVGANIRNQGVWFSPYLRIVGPRGTEFDWWMIGFRALSLFAFLQRYSWGQMRFTVEFRGKTRLSKAWRWPSPRKAL